MTPRSSPRRRGTPYSIAAGVVFALLGGFGLWAWRQSPIRPARPPAAHSPTPSRPESRPRRKSGARADNTAAEKTSTALDSRQTSRPSETERSSASRSAAQRGKPQEPFLVTVETNEPGFLLEVDGIVARDEQGELLLTPCEIPLEPGPRSFRLARKGYRDITQQVVIIERETVSFTATYDPFGEPTGYFASPFHQTPVGQLVDLSQVLPEGQPQTPWISQDGLDLFFCGESSAGRGVFHAQRSHPDLMFEPAVLVQRTSELVTSPSASRDGLQVAYVLPLQRQIRSLIRSERSEAFRSGPPLLFEEESTARWTRAFLTPDTRQLLVFTTEPAPHHLRTARRREDSSEFAFSGPTRPAPVNAPCLSADGSMWYWLADKRLLKARRQDQGNPFENGKSVCQLPEALAGDSGLSQGFALSHDEQWLWFAQATKGQPSLSALRIQGAPSHGLTLVGRPHVSTPLVTETRPEQPESKTPLTPDTKDTPPREVPDYPAFRRRLVDHLLTGNLDAAHQLWTEKSQQQTDPATAAVLQGDAVELELARGFWQRLQRALMTLQPGDKLRLGGGNRTVAEVDAASGTVVTKTNSGQERRWVLKDLPVNELVMLADRAEEGSSPQSSLESTQMLLWGDQTETADFRNRLQRAEGEQDSFRARWNARELLELRCEAEAGNLSQARRLIEQLVRRAPHSPEAVAARHELAAFPSRMKWIPQGGQRWHQPGADVWEPQQPRATGGYLASGLTYRNFRITLDWRTTEATAQGGVFFRYSGSGPLRKNAWKLQLSNDAGLASPDRFSTGALFGIKPPSAHPIRPAGEWNSLELEVKGDRATARINGEPVLAASLSDPNIPPSGSVCLDGELGGISYRQVIIEPLPDTD